MRERQNLSDRALFRSTNGPQSQKNRLPENVFHFLEETRRSFRRLILHLRQHAELLQQSPLLARDLARNHNPYADVEVATPAIGIRHSFRSLTKYLPRLRSFRNVEVFFSLQRGDANCRPQRSLRNAHRNRAIKICPAAFEKCVVLYFEKNI